MSNTLTNNNNEYYVYSYLMSSGYNLAQACGILSNIESESRFNPIAYNVSEQAYGICQWRLGRRTLLHQKYGSSPTLMQQVAYINYELENTESAAKPYLNVPNTRKGAYDCAYYFAKKYERCNAIYHIPRAERAYVYWEYYNKSGGIHPEIVAMDIPDISWKDTAGSTVIIGDEPVPVSDSIGSYGNVLTSIDMTNSIVKNNLSRVTSAGYDYGYLIDMTYGRDFKFYIPEFSESAGANWEDISIPGRSVQIKSYESTTSRSITVSLELYAGVGLYELGEDVVGAMHRDINFVKSLEYPDYSSVIAYPPPTVHLILGSSVSLVGVVNDVRVEHMKPLDAQNRSMYVKLSFTVIQNVSDPPGVHDIRSNSAAMISTEDLNTLG